MNWKPADIAMVKALAGEGGGGGGGVTPNIQATAETLPAGSVATVTRTGSDANPVFNFGIPKGDPGDPGTPGAPGAKGDPGKDATINGKNAVTLAAGDNVSITTGEDGTVTISASGGGAGEVYSTEEQVIGTWIDGRPLYQITIGAVLNHTGDTLFNISKPRASIRIIDIQGVIYKSETGRVPIPTQYGKYYGFECSAGMVYGYTNNDALLGKECYATIKYINVNDQATIEIPAPEAMTSFPAAEAKSSNEGEV